ncbi:MAG: CopG family transcriptional regulator [Gammaproteobacteria bacterium]|nr:MAG: CopG family transcriptional regulator [Gammaproteobacteria bacterium]
MTQISARLPDELVDSLDMVAKRLKRSRAEVVRQALEGYLEDFDDLTETLQRLQDPTDPVLDWEDVKRDLFPED